MSSGCTKESAEKAVSNYIKTIEKQRDLIKKNLNDMDFQNTDVRDRYDEIIQDITNECNGLITYIEGINFN